MKKKKIYSVLCFLVLSLCLNAQDLSFINNGSLNGEFQKFYGAKGGKSVKVAEKNNTISVDFSGEESWAGTDYSVSKDSSFVTYNLSAYKFLVFTIKASAPVVIDKIGIGGDDEKTHYVRNLKVDTSWMTIALAVPPGFEDQKRVFSVVTTKKFTLELSQLYYGNVVPTKDGVLVLEPSEKKERIEDANYIFSEGFETGAPSGYSGEKNGLSMMIDGNCMENPYSGRYCLKIEVDDKEAWRALFIQYSGKWTAELNPKTELPDLSQYKKLVFYARTTTKDYYIPEVGFGASSTVFSQEKRDIVFVELTKEWKRYEIDLRGLDKESVNDVMMFSLNEGTLYLDEIRFEK